MVRINEGQCGVCAHFGEHDAGNDRLVQIKVRGEGPEDFVEECGHPQHAGLHLKVTPISGCDGFTPARTSAA